MAKSKAPLLINSCEFDDQFDQNAQAVVDKMMGDGKFAPGYERTYWDGCTHGFAVRGDLVSFLVPICCAELELVIHDADCTLFCRATPKSRRAKKVPSKLLSSSLTSTFKMGHVRCLRVVIRIGASFRVGIFC